MLIDVHAHLDFKDFDKDLDFVIKRFNGIIISNSVDLNSMKKNLEISKKYDKVKIALGIYPLYALKLEEKEFEKQIQFIRENKDGIVAIGEIGIDFKQSEEREKQIRNFKEFVKLSEEIKKPLIIHSRGACEEVLDLLKDIKSKIVLHYFDANTTLVRKALELGFNFSIPTNISTSKNLKKLVKVVPIENLLTETDSPYLSPIKGERNEPLNVKHTIKVISEIKGLSEQEVEDKIYENYLRIFL